MATVDQVKGLVSSSEKSSSSSSKSGSKRSKSAEVKKEASLTSD